jgi:NADPH:quinone reductase-like Zn-dependent oxidoreductase
MKAIKTPSLGRAELVEGVPIPSLEGHPAFLLVKTKYVGVNHCDYACTDMQLMFGAHNTIGGEYCGEVVAAGAENTRFKKGDRVAGCVFPTGPAMPDAGTHAEYILVKGDAQLSVDAMDPVVGEQFAAGLGIAFSTMFYGMYYTMKLPWPTEPAPNTTETKEKQSILIYGGTTNTGMIAIQFAKLSGLKVLTTCSPSNFERVKELGASDVFDYHDAEKCAEEVRLATADGLKLVFDCVGAFQSPQICAGAMSSQGGGVYISVSPQGLPRDDISTVMAQGQNVLGEPFQFAGQTLPADPEAFRQWVKFIPTAEGLLKDNKIRLTPVSVIKGLENIPGQFQDLREWKLSATKLICEV